MNRRTCRRLFVAAATVFALLVMTLGYEWSQRITSWNSPRMLAIQSQYESLLDAAHKTTQGPAYVAKYGFKNEILTHTLYHIVTSNLSAGDLRQLAATCGTLPTDENDWSPFTKDVFSYMMQSIVDSGDRDIVLKTLSTRCPDCIWYSRFVEFYLAEKGEMKLKDPVLLLGEAYFKCRDPEVRHRIATAVRRGFTSSGIRGKDDAEFVSNAMRWYQKESGHLMLNPRHGVLMGKIPPHEESDPNFKSMLQFDKMPPLFVERPH